MKAVLFHLLSLCALARSQAGMSVYGCTGTNFGGDCQTYDCPYEGCCELPPFFQNSLVSVKSTGPYGFRLFTAAGCSGHCNDNDNASLQVDGEGYSNIGPAAFVCVDGPY